MSNKSYFWVILAVIAILILYASMFVVMEGQRAIVVKLGEIVTNPKTGQADIMAPGLHFKVPFVTNVRDLSVKLQTMNVDSQRILTAEQKHVMVSYYVKWRINDLPLFYTRTGGGYEVRAEQLLQQKINGALRAAFGKLDITEVISGERLNVMSLLKKQAEESAAGLGIKVTDVRIVGIDLPESVQESVFKRMRTEREQVATQYRAQGRAKQESVMANADREVVVDVATARAGAQKVRAAGDQEAGKIYSDAYSKDPHFYALYRSLEAYRNVFDKSDTVMVLRPQGQFFKYFTQTQAKKK
jgi:membrane protease subunit HflC